MPGKIKNRTALVFGATGLVGKFLVRDLMDHVSYSSVHLFIRKPVDYNHLKINEHLIDFDKLEDYSDLIRGDDLFICLGTTLRKAGSVAGVEKTDRDLPIRIARMAYENGVSRVAIVSSVGADSGSRNYYLRIKGEMEEELQKIPFEQTVIVRPSILLGSRKNFRLGELFGKLFAKIFSFIMIGPLAKYRGIHAHTVSTAMIALIKSAKRKIIYESAELQKAGKK